MTSVSPSHFALVARIALRVVRLVDGNPPERILVVVEEDDLGRVHHDLVREPHPRHTGWSTAEGGIFRVAVEVEALHLVPELRLVDWLVRIGPLVDAAVALEVRRELARRGAERGALAARVQLQVDVALLVGQVGQRPSAAEPATAAAPPAVQIGMTVGHPRRRRVVRRLRGPASALRERGHERHRNDRGRRGDAAE